MHFVVLAFCNVLHPCCAYSLHLAGKSHSNFREESNFYEPKFTQNTRQEQWQQQRKTDVSVKRRHWCFKMHWVSLKCIDAMNAICCVCVCVASPNTVRTVPFRGIFDVQQWMHSTKMLLRHANKTQHVNFDCDLFSLLSSSKEKKETNNLTVTKRVHACVYSSNSSNHSWVQHTRLGESFGSRDWLNVICANTCVLYTCIISENATLIKLKIVERKSWWVAGMYCMYANHVRKLLYSVIRPAHCHQA